MPNGYDKGDGRAPKAGASIAGATVHVRRKLRVGLFADAAFQPRWFLDAMLYALGAGFVEFVLIADGGQVPEVLPLLWRIYGFFDALVFGAPQDPSQLLHLKTGIPHAHSLSLPHADADPLQVAAWRASIKKLGLDVAFATGRVPDEILDGTATYGVWRFFFGDKRRSREAAAAIRETAGGAGVILSGISVRLGRGYTERLVYRSWSRTFAFSLSRTRSNMLCKTAHFARRALGDLYRSEQDWLRDWHSRPAASLGAPLDVPVAAGAARDIAAIARRIASRSVQKLLYRDQWFIAYRFTAEEGWHADLCKYICLMPPKDRFWADPFPVMRNGRNYIFFEELVFTEGKGHISVVEVDRTGLRSGPMRVLEKDYHLSYPFILEQGGELYMIPESGDNRTVELYRCVEFPHRWQLEKILLAGRWFTDATLHGSGANWWMFVNVGIEGGEAHDELHLYSAPGILGPWKPHPRNPVKSDVRSARPAGRVYQRDGVLLRPAQICAPIYGSGVALNRVLELSADAYAESECQRILPTRPGKLLGVHTLNRTGDLCVIDGFMRRLRAGRAGMSVRVPRNKVEGPSRHAGAGRAAIPEAPSISDAMGK